MSNQDLIIKQAEDRDQKRWDDFIEKNHSASPYHFFAWKKAIEMAYKHKCRYFYLEKNRQIVGAMPLVHLFFPSVINEMVGLPYCDVGNCVTSHEAYQDILLTEILKDLDNGKVKKIQIRGPMEQTELLKSIMISIKTDKVRMFIDLPSSSDELFKSFQSKLRSQIKKAQKNGVVFRWGCLNDFDEAYAIFSKNMHELGSPVHSKLFLKSILACYDDRAKLGLALYKGQIVGMGVILLGNATVSIPWASTIREFNRLNPNMLLYWNLLKFSCENGFTVFDFGRSSVDEGTYKFKKQWGAKPVPLIWYQSKNKKIKISQKERKKDRKYAADLWRKIPYRLANLIGPHIRKYISL